MNNFANDVTLKIKAWESSQPSFQSLISTISDWRDHVRRNERTLSVKSENESSPHIYHALESIEQAWNARDNFKLVLQYSKEFANHLHQHSNATKSQADRQIASRSDMAVKSVRENENFTPFLDFIQTRDAFATIKAMPSYSLAQRKTILGLNSRLNTALMSYRDQPEIAHNIQASIKLSNAVLNYLNASEVAVKANYVNTKIRTTLDALVQYMDKTHSLLMDTFYPTEEKPAMKSSGRQQIVDRFDEVQDTFLKYNFQNRGEFAGELAQNIVGLYNSIKSFNEPRILRRLNEAYALAVQAKKASIISVKTQTDSTLIHDKINQSMAIIDELANSIANGL